MSDWKETLPVAFLLQVNIVYKRAVSHRKGEFLNEGRND